MATEWFDRKPGDGYVKATDPDDPLGEQLMILGGAIPDWIRVPDNAGPPYAGVQLRVTRHFVARCPTCKTAGAKILELETPDEWKSTEDNPESRLHSSECTNCGQFTIYWATYTVSPPRPPLSPTNTDIPPNE